MSCCSNLPLSPLKTKSQSQNPTSIHSNNKSKPKSPKHVHQLAGIIKISFQSLLTFRASSFNFCLCQLLRISSASLILTRRQITLIFIFLSSEIIPHLLISHPYSRQSFGHFILELLATADLNSICFRLKRCTL